MFVRRPSSKSACKGNVWLRGVLLGLIAVVLVYLLASGGRSAIALYVLAAIVLMSLVLWDGSRDHRVWRLLVVAQVAAVYTVGMAVYALAGHRQGGIDAAVLTGGVIVIAAWGLSGILRLGRSSS